MNVPESVVASAPSTAPRKDATSAAPTHSAASSQPAVDITAITSRDDFLLELGQTLEGQAAVRPVETAEAAVESLGAGKRAQLLVIDARALSNLKEAVDSAAARAPRAVVIVFAEASSEKQVAGALKGSKVFAVLPTPLDARKTQAVFEGAIQEALSSKATAAQPEAPAASAAGELSIGSFRPATAASPYEQREQQGPGKRLWLVLGVLAALALAAGGYWYFTQQPHAARASAASAARAAPPAAAPAAATAPPAEAPGADTLIVQGKVDDLLEKARLAMHERRFTEPASDSALVYYRSAAAADPQNGEARDGLQRVAGVLAGRFEEALGGARFDEATQTLANFKAAVPGDARIAGFDQRLYAATLAHAVAEGNFERAGALLRQAQQTGTIPADQLAKWRSDVARHAEDAKVSHLAGLIGDRIRENKLTEADDSAKVYLQQLQAAAPANPATARALKDLQGAYLRKAREAALAHNSAEEDRWLAEARGLGMKPAELNAFQRDLTSARQKAQQAESDKQLALARERLRDGRLTEPAQDSAAFYLGQVQAADPSNAALGDAGHELAARLLERARASATAGKSVEADLSLARRWGAAERDLQAVQQLASAPKASVVDPATLAGNLKRLRAPPPEYPQSALDRKITGTVSLAFTVDVSGEPRDIHVVEATPPGVFDKAALAAVRHWRYAPMVINGAPVEVPVRTLMRFELPK